MSIQKSILHGMNRFLGYKQSNKVCAFRYSQLSLCLFIKILLMLALSSFVKRKLNSSLHHKFAVASFSSSHEFEFLCNFTRSQDVVQGAIDKMSYSDASSVNSPSPTARTGEAVAEIKNDDEDNEEDCVDLSLLLNNIAKKLQLPSTSEEQEQFSQIPLMSHHYITRIILLYNRSNEVLYNWNCSCFFIHSVMVFFELLLILLDSSIIDSCTRLAVYNCLFGHFVSP